MSDQQPQVSTSSHAVPGGEEVDVSITIPTPAINVHPDVLVVPADNKDAAPVPAGTLAPDVNVVSPDAPDVTYDEAVHPDATTTAGAVPAGTPVVRVDDPDKTPTPAGDLDPAAVVHNPDAGPVPGTGPVTAAELAAVVHDKTTGESPGTSDEWQHVLDGLAAAGFVITRK